MLKSVANVPEDITLVQNLKFMYLAGGFRLTKFVSNSAELLMSIPQKTGDNQLQIKICYKQNIGEGFNILSMSSGADSKNKYCFPCWNIKNDICNNGIS